VKIDYPHISLQRLCDEFGKHRQSWYEATWRADDQLLVEGIVLEEVLRIRGKIPGIGSKKLHFLLKGFLAQHRIKMGIKALNTLLKREDMLVKRKRKRAVTTNSRHYYRKYPNLIEDMEVLRPCHVWVSDITYILIAGGFGYLSLLTDSYSRMVLGWSLQDTLKATGPLEALSMALAVRTYCDKTLIHHSDRGRHGMVFSIVVVNT